MRLLVVIDSEIAGVDEVNEWATLSTLVAMAGPESIEAKVLALVHRPPRSIIVASPLGRTAAKLPRWDSTPAEIYSPSESARGRAERAVLYLRSLGVKARGDIEPGDPYRAVRRAVDADRYDRVLVLASNTRIGRVTRRSLAVRLRRSLAVPVDSPTGRSIALPS